MSKFSLRISDHLPAPVEWRRRELEKCNFREFKRPMSSTLTLNRVIRHTVVHQSSTSIYMLNFTEIVKTFCGRTYGRTYGRIFLPSNVIRSTWRMWADAQRDGRPAEYRWCPLRKFRNSIVPGRKVRLTPTAGCRAVTLSI